jgi:hypothetical protein
VGLALALTAVLLAACDPGWAIVAENKSSLELLARTSGSTGTEDVQSVVSVPAGSRITLGTNGVASLVGLRTVEILTPSCAVIATVAMDAFNEGGVIVIDEGPTVETRPGGNPSRGADGQASQQCGLASPSP